MRDGADLNDDIFAARTSATCCPWPVLPPLPCLAQQGVTRGWCIDLVHMGDIRALTPQQMEEYERDGAAPLCSPLWLLLLFPPGLFPPAPAETDEGHEAVSHWRPGAGFLLLQNWLDAAEVEQMLAIAKADHAFTDAGTDLTDADGNISRLSLRMWELPEDTYSAFVRHPAIVGPLQQLHGPMYHFHHKMMLNFGYWYSQGYMRSDLASCMIACDRASKENGCLKARTLPPSLCRCASHPVCKLRKQAA